MNITTFLNFSWTAPPGGMVSFSLKEGASRAISITNITVTSYTYFISPSPEDCTFVVTFLNGRAFQVYFNVVQKKSFLRFTVFTKPLSAPTYSDSTIIDLQENQVEHASILSSGYLGLEVLYKNN